MCRPPLMSMISPVMKPAWGDTRKAIRRATSSGSQKRPTGICRMQSLALNAGELLGDHGCPHVGGGHSVDRYAVGRDLPREGEGQRAQPAFGGRIGGSRGEAAGLHGQRTDVDHAAPVLLAHAWKQGAREIEGAVQVDRHEPVPLVHCRALGLVVGEDAGVVDQCIDGAILLADGLAGLFHGDRTAYIHDQRRRPVTNLPCLFLQPVGGDVHHQDAVPVRNQLARHRGAEDAGGAGDDREPFVVHRHHSTAGGASRPR